MAKPTTQRWTKLTIWVGDGGSPEDFNKYVCGLTTKSFTLQGQTSDTVVPDCDDPDQPAWIERVMRSLSSSVAGAGVMAEENRDFFADWMLSGASKNCRIAVDGTDAIYFAGAYLLTKFELTGNESDGKINVSLAFDSDGEVTRATGQP
jgi:hypothetical protein